MGHLVLINSSVLRHIRNKVFDGGKKTLNIIGNGIYHKLTSGLFTWHMFLKEEASSLALGAISLLDSSSSEPATLC